MLKVVDYRRHADECRRLASNAAYPHIKDELLKMAAAWDELAGQRELLLKHKSEPAE